MAPKNCSFTMQDNQSYSPPPQTQNDRRQVPHQRHQIPPFRRNGNGMNNGSSHSMSSASGHGMNNASSHDMNNNASSHNMNNNASSHSMSSTRSGGSNHSRRKEPSRSPAAGVPSSSSSSAQRHRSSSQSSRPSNGVSRRQHASAADRGRRRPTNYTASYAPPADLVALAAETRAKQQSRGGSSSRRKCSSLDRSEDDGDERRRHLRSGKQQQQQQQQQGEQQQQQHQQRREERRAAAQRNDGGRSERSGRSGGDQSKGDPRQQRQGGDERLSYERAQLQRMQKQLRQEQMQLKRQQQQQQQQHQHQQQRRSTHEQQQQLQRHSAHEQRANHHSNHDEKRSHERRGGTDRRRREGGNGRSGGASSSRGSASRGVSSSSSRKSSSKGSRPSSSRDNGPASAEDEELQEQLRIEEYAGKRALLRLEQELADHSESRPGVMDRRKLARVPQVKKGDLIIGEYLGRGNFCDVFEVTWTLPEQRDAGGARMWSSNRTLKTYSTDGTDDNSQDSAGLEEGMDSLALSCSNDLNLARSASRRSVSQIRTAAPGGVRRGRMDAFAGSPSGPRNPNVLALKCLRPAVRAQPRKFVIGAEDLAHETALLACLDHPNIIQLYGRAEGCFSTAFQMRSKSAGDNGGGGDETPREGKRMSDEGYFIILDRLMTTLTDRIDEWKSECRAINGVSPPDGTPVQMPPESTLREHLCKRLKVAYCIADAIEYLHSRHCVFRDLKPANVGFDCNDCVKMFDFGFATSIAPLLSKPYEGYGPLTETCGTRRYMAPEVALKLGYGKEVDVYSFGMLLWEICALDKPFDSIQSVDEFHDLVVLCGKRPGLNIDPLWTASLKNLMCRCWSTDPLDRPTMCEVKTLLCNVLRDMNKAMETSSQNRSGGNGTAAKNARAGGRGNTAQRQEQGGNFINKWRRRVSI